MSAPRIVLVFELEAAPRIALEIKNESEFLRLRDWIVAHPPFGRDIQTAIRLAPTLAVCRALLEGRHVPVDVFDPYWAEAYGLL